MFKVEAKVTADVFILKPRVDAVHKVLVHFAKGLQECGAEPEQFISHFTAESFISRLEALGFTVAAKGE